MSLLEWRKVFAVLYLLLTLIGCQSISPDIPRIAIMSAFERELEPLLKQTTVESTQTINSITFTTGTLAGQKVLLFLSDVSMVNAAMNTQLALDHFSISQIIFSGIGGGIAPDLQIGDVVIPAQWAQYQESVYVRPAADGTLIPPIWLDDPLPAYGIMFPKPVELQGADRVWFPAVVIDLPETLSLEQCLNPQPCLPREPRLIMTGTGVSGQGFVDNADFAAYLHQTFGAAVVDMESAAVAQVAYVNNIPFLAVRGISDLPGSTSAEAMTTFYPLAADNATAVTLAFLAAVD
ncbi:MAG: 5'-methylthioadenosine/S-adenosylhomocysteine nucleosidase [Anaerolineae bacterium]|nr:5'-methylthioadenosine/S-adenosylhomocysteine nucleosidase [Anaerolineae bacterium]